MKSPSPKSGFSKNFLIRSAIVLTLLFVFQKMLVSSVDPAVGGLDEATLYSEMESPTVKINALVFESGAVSVYMPGLHGHYTVVAPSDADQNAIRQSALAANSKYKAGISITNRTPDFWLSLLVSLLPTLLFIGLYFYMMRSMQVGAGGRSVVGITSNKAKKFVNPTLKFSDVIGQEEAKEDLQEIVRWLSDPAQARKDGLEIPTGVLMTGGPGTGKTLLASAVAGEAKVPFFTISGSEFVEMYVGVGASRVRSMFAEAEQYAPCIIFIDEIDAVGRHRGSGMGGGYDEREQTLNQLLVEMDGITEKTANDARVIVIAATNRPDVLDKALLRPGRLTRQVHFELPPVEDRLKLFEYYLTKKQQIKVAADVKLREYATIVAGMSGADIANVVNEAFVFRSRRISKGDKNLELTREDLDKSVSKIKYGAERKSLVVSEEDKKRTSAHECGHGTTAYELLGPECVRKATIIPAGRAAGYFDWLIDGNPMTYSKLYLLNIITIMVAGRVGQQHLLKVDQEDSGVASDYQKAWGLARQMVAEWGMSDLGIIYSPMTEEMSPMGRSTTCDASEVLKMKIEDRVRKIIADCEMRAKRIIEKYSSRFERLHNELLKRETLLGDEIRSILGAKEVSTVPTA